MVATARERAEEVFQSFQKRAKELLEAEEGLIKMARHLIEEQGLKPSDVRRRLDAVLGRLKANKLWCKVLNGGAVVALHDYREGVERYAGESLSKLAQALHLATKDDIRQLNKQSDNINRKLTQIAQNRAQNNRVRGGSASGTSAGSAGSTGSASSAGASATAANKRSSSNRAASGTASTGTGTSASKRRRRR